MAIPITDNELNKDKDQQGQSTLIGGQQPSTITPASNSKGTSSGRFTNIQKYVQAQAPSQQGLGQKIAQNIQTQGQNVQGQIKQAGEQFQEQAKQNFGGFGDEQKQFVNQTIGQAVQGQGPLAKEDVQKFAGLRDAQYTGPTNISNVGGLTSGTERVSQLGKMGETEAGRFGLLKQMFGRPTYSGGQQKLDQLFLQSKPQDTRALSQSRTVGTGLQQQLAGTQQSAQQTAQQLAEQAQQARDTISGALTGETGAIAGAKQDLESRLQQQQASRNAEREALKQGLSSRQLSDAQLQQLGLTRGTQTFGLDLNQYLRDTPELSRGNVATQQDAAKFAALSQLANQDELSNYVTPEAAPENIKFGTKQLQSDIAMRRGALNQESNPVATNINNLNKIIDKIGSTEYSSHKLSDSDLKSLSEMGVSNKDLNKIILQNSGAGGMTNKQMKAVLQQALGQQGTQYRQIRDKYGYSEKI